MSNLLRSAIQLKKQKLINKLIKSGIYKRGNKHLYELTLSDLENEYKYNEKKSSDRNKKWNLNLL
ncbi:Fur-regulated basic protein FbpA [Neobacillus cucumis]|uniref:Fur-regulated basic protein FbpA n=1 Tax=Neobacillus cucumis TaxID=1740721 RepID=UPI0028531D75|nr:Fur-regulated basic protein FbpA [Neobacillus cucumis]MDR4947212.1 Fur-regulated basic protein FbpA [Neobacillus cucumis]